MQAGAQLTKRGVPRLLSVGAISEATSVPASTWYTIIARGELPAVKIGRAVRVKPRPPEGDRGQVKSD